jgi:DNA helicase HerA-like ATPase
MLLMMLAPHIPHAPLIVLATIDPIEVELARAMSSRSNDVEVGQIVGYVPTHLVRFTKLKVVRVESTFTPLRRRVAYRVRLRRPKHILIAGMTGYGKSMTAAKMAAVISKTVHAKVVIIDPHGEYSQLIRKYTPSNRIYIVDALKAPLNPLDNMGLNPLERIAEITMLFRKLYRIGPIQSEILVNALKEAYEVKGIRLDEPSTWRREPPTISDLVKVLRAYARVEQRAITLLNHVEALWNPTIYSRTTNLLPLIENPSCNIVVIDLHNIPTKEQQSLYAATLLRHLYNYARQTGKTSATRLVVIVDEAHIVASEREEEDILASYTAELRKYGVALMIIIQNPRELSRTTLSNIAVRMLFRITEPEALNYTASYVLGAATLAETVKVTLQMLEPGYALVGEDELPLPLIVRTL